MDQETLSSVLSAVLPDVEELYRRATKAEQAQILSKRLPTRIKELLASNLDKAFYKFHGGATNDFSRFARALFKAVTISMYSAALKEEAKRDLTSSSSPS